MLLHPLTEDCTHSCPHGFRMVEIGTCPNQQHRPDAQGVCRADNSAHIAGVLHIFQHNGIPGSNRREFVRHGTHKERAGA